MSLSKVFVRRDSLVKAKEDSDQVRLKEETLLSAMSHGIAFVPYRNRILFFRRSSQTLSMREVVLQMQESVSAVLAEFYTLAGRIRVREDNRMALVCNNAGIKFIEAQCDLCFGVEDEFDLDMELLGQLCQAPGFEHSLKWPWPSDAPLLFIQVSFSYTACLFALKLKQVTEFSCGGFCLGLKYNHQLMDGTSLWHFVKSWAEVSCGKPVSLRPDLTLDPIKIPGPGSLPPPLPPRMKLSSRNNGVPRNEQAILVTKRFRFRSSWLQVLKSNYPGFTKFQLLTSHVWSSITKARELTDENTSTFYFAINCRGRSSLPTAYFGASALGLSTVTMTCAELSTAALELVASSIKQATHSYTGDRKEMVDRAFEHYASDPVSLPAFEVCTGRDIMIGSSFNFPVYQEFAWGTPFEMAMVQAPSDGSMYYFPGREQGSVYLYMTLSETAMLKLERDTCFMGENDKRTIRVSEQYEETANASDVRPLHFVTA